LRFHDYFTPKKKRKKKKSPRLVLCERGRSIWAKERVWTHFVRNEVG